MEKKRLGIVIIVLCLIVLSSQISITAVEPEDADVSPYWSDAYPWRTCEIKDHNAVITSPTLINTVDPAEYGAWYMPHLDNPYCAILEEAVGGGHLYYWNSTDGGDTWSKQFEIIADSAYPGDWGGCEDPYLIYEPKCDKFFMYTERKNEDVSGRGIWRVEYSGTSFTSKCFTNGTYVFNVTDGRCQYEAASPGLVKYGNYWYILYEDHGSNYGAEDDMLVMWVHEDYIGKSNRSDTIYWSNDKMVINMSYINSQYGGGIEVVPDYFLRDNAGRWYMTGHDYEVSGWWTSLDLTGDDNLDAEGWVPASDDARIALPTKITGDNLKDTAIIQKPGGWFYAYRALSPTDFYRGGIGNYNESDQDVSTYPTLSVYLEDANGDTITAYFRTNASGSWQTLKTSSGGNGTFTCTATTPIDTNNTIYWWSINTTDISGSGDWTNQSFFFITNSEGDLPPEDNSLQFISINDETNGTVFQTTTPTFNGTMPENTSTIWLQVSDSYTNWTEGHLVVNLSNISESEFPSYFTAINSTRWSFTLPEAYAITPYKWYYCRFETYTLG